MKIDLHLVRTLVLSQFPNWRELSIIPVAESGWDNRMFRLGEDLVIRMPSAKEYASSIEKELTWLPRLALHLPISIPIPVAIGKPGNGYPWNWSIYRWLEGTTVATITIPDKTQFAKSLGKFLLALEKIDPSGGPLPGKENFFRGGELIVYDYEVRQAVSVLKNKVDENAAIQLWETAILATFTGRAVWIHGDIALANLLAKESDLVGVIDFGQLAVGDPACDLSIAWTFFENKSRKVFQDVFAFDKETWLRAKGWALWKALIVAAGFVNPNTVESRNCWHILDEIFKDNL